MLFSLFNKFCKLVILCLSMLKNSTTTMKEAGSNSTKKIKNNLQKRVLTVEYSSQNLAISLSNIRKDLNTLIKAH